MSGGQVVLPSGFESLERFVDTWALSGADNRLQQRLATSDAQRADFFGAAMALLPAALDYLDSKPLHEHDEREERLMNLLLSLCHVALAVEIQGDDEAKHALARRHMTITRASADRRC
jgi:hypothetical protein